MNSSLSATPSTVQPPAGAVHLGDWELSDDDRVAHRWFHCGDHATAGGLRTKVHGMQYVDGSVDGLSISISDKNSDVSFEAADIAELMTHLTHVSSQHDRLTLKNANMLRCNAFR